MDVCAKLKGILKEKKLGHAGTLDPYATGVLPVALGIATKDVEKTADEKKIYRATMLLGCTTDTDDVTGKILYEYKGILPDEGSIREVLFSFVGEYDQLPPMYSARKVRGKKLYEYARRGIEVQRKPKRIRIYDIKLEKIELPKVFFTLSCSKGTYVRSLVRDAGEKLGCGACVEELARLSVGDFCIENSLKLAEIESLMQNDELDEALYIKSPSAIAIGKFDGTHLGHQLLLNELKKIAARLNLKTVVIVFRFRQKEISTAEDLRKRMAELGIDYCIELKFTDTIKNTEALTFLKDVLIKKYNMKAIVAGEDVGFGKDRQGDASFLREYQDKLGYEVRIIKKLSLWEENKDLVISSSLLRDRLDEGRMDSARRILGRYYELEGEIVAGRHIGTDKINIPTLNIMISEEIIVPRHGVYMVRFSLLDPATGKELYKGDGIANLGYAPTVDKGRSLGLRLEVHSFKELEDCYGLFGRVELLKFLRPEKSFASLDELRDQILTWDIPQAKEFFKKEYDA